MPTLQFETHPDYEALSRRAAELIVAELRADPSLLLCPATGGSPTGTYARLAEICREEPALFSRMRVLKLDEWGGLAPDDPGTCEVYLRNHLLGPLGVSEDRYFAFHSDPADPEAECRRVAGLLEQVGPIGVCVLGIGLNGHLAMNEPADALRRNAHVAGLTEQTLRHPMLEASPSRPSYGLTLGMAELLQSRKVLLLINGAHKREPLARLRDERVRTDFPASFLHLHGNAAVLHDAAAAEAA